MAGTASRLSSRPATVTRWNHHAPSGMTTASAASVASTTPAASLASRAARHDDSGGARLVVAPAGEGLSHRGIADRMPSVAPTVSHSPGSKTEDGCPTTMSATVSATMLMAEAGRSIAWATRAAAAMSVARQTELPRVTAAAKTTTVASASAARSGGRARVQARTPSTSPVKIATLPPEMATTWNVPAFWRRSSVGASRPDRSPMRMAAVTAADRVPHGATACDSTCRT